MPQPKKQPPLSVPHLTPERPQALRGLLPKSFSEGRIDFEKLHAALGDIVEGSQERHQLQPDEARKIQCGAPHFREALGVMYQVVTGARDLN